MIALRNQYRRETIKQSEHLSGRENQSVSAGRLPQYTKIRRSPRLGLARSRVQEAKPGTAEGIPRVQAFIAGTQMRRGWIPLIPDSVNIKFEIGGKKRVKGLLMY